MDILCTKGSRKGEFVTNSKVFVSCDENMSENFDNSTSLYIA
jgi:hypothetical protein